MKKNLRIIFCVIFLSSIYSFSDSNYEKPEAAAASSQNAAAMSMVAWGLILGVGIAIAAILISSSSAHD